MAFNNNLSNQYFYNSWGNCYPTSNGSTPSNNTLSPDYCQGSSSSKLSVHDDGLSVSSSALSTPEFEEKQILNAADMFHNHLETRSPMIDPVVLNVSSIAITRQEDAFEQVMMAPLLESDSYFNYQKLLSHSNDQLHVSYGVLSAAPFTLSNSVFSTPQNGCFHQVPFATFCSNSRYTDVSATPEHSYQQVQYTTQTSSSRFTNYSTPNLPSFSEPITDTPEMSKTNVFKQTLKTQQNLFVCTVPTCNKAFNRPYNLKSHMRTHTHERPFECQYKPCGWTFARPHDLKRHELQHTGQKPHSCRFCQKKFARSDALKRHWKVDIACSEALEEETRLNGGKEVKYPRRKRSKKTN